MIKTPLHPGAMHEHKTDVICRGWTADAKRYKIHVCACGAVFFFEPDLYSAA